MQLKGVNFADTLLFSPGNISGVYRGFLSEEIVQMAFRSRLGFVATVRQGKSAYTSENPSREQWCIAESGVRVSEWAYRKVKGNDVYVCASREETANKISRQLHLDLVPATVLSNRKVRVGVQYFMSVPMISNALCVLLTSLWMIF